MSLSSARGCGTRVAGGIYAECESAPFGQPVEYFLICPPRVMHWDAIGLASLGVKIVPANCEECGGSGKTGIPEATCRPCFGKGEVYHLMNWIGEGHYPNVADEIEEIRALGGSWRVQSTLDFSLITPASKILLVHRKASIKNCEAYYKNELEDLADQIVLKPCPKGIPHHTISPPQESVFEMCARLYWQDLIECDEPANPVMHPIRTRSIPCGHRYQGTVSRAGKTPRYEAAVFAWFPLHRFAVIEDPDGGTHTKAMDRASKSLLPVSLEEA